MKKLTANQQILADDILRYKKNKLASALALLGLAFNCLYFLLLYSMPRSEFTTISIGFSIILTLVMLLTIFLSSEGVKGYNKKFSIVLLVCAAFQILRIFYYPLKGITNNWLVAANVGDAGMNYIGYFGWYPSFTDPKSTVFFVLMLVYLIASAACLIGSAVWGFIVATRLERFQKNLDEGNISINDAMAAVEAEEAAAQAKATDAQPQAIGVGVVEADDESSVSVDSDEKPSSEVE